MNFFLKALRRSVQILAGRGLLTPIAAAKLLHLADCRRWPDIRNPRDLNEKIMQMEFFSDTSEWTRLADKVKVRDFVASKGLADILIPLLGVYRTADEIDFDALPESFVIKPNNGSAQAVVVDDKSAVDQAAIRRTVAHWSDRQFGIATAEPHYTRIPPLIMAEKRLQTPDGSLPIDYKFYCFGGRPLNCLVCSERNTKDFHSHFNLYSVEPWSELTECVKQRYRASRPFPKPEKLAEMLRIAAKLSKGFPFVRIDLYEVDGKVWFGEMTFTPFACRNDNLTRDTLLRLGSLIPVAN